MSQIFSYCSFSNLITAAKHL